MFDAVIFDCDGVLVDSEILAAEIEQAALAEIGLVYERDEYMALFMGMSTEAFYEAIEYEHRARYDRSLPEGFQARCHARYREAWPRLTAVPGVRKAVEGVPCLRAVASSSTADALARKLERTGLWALFAPHVYSADHVTYAKPAPDLFLFAADALKVEPERCLVIEDSINGVMAARAAGMTVWGFLGGAHMSARAGERLTAAGAARLVGDWTEARELFAEEFGGGER